MRKGRFSAVLFYVVVICNRPRQQKCALHCAYFAKYCAVYCAVLKPRSAQTAKFLAVSIPFCPQLPACSVFSYSAVCSDASEVRHRL